MCKFDRVEKYSAKDFMVFPSSHSIAVSAFAHRQHTMPGIVQRFPDLVIITTGDWATRNIPIDETLEQQRHIMDHHGSWYPLVI